MDIIQIEGEGFKPLKDYGSWRVAQLGYSQEVNSTEGFKTMGRHMKTDEVFILLEGEARMVTAGFQEKPEGFAVEKLEHNKLYVVRERLWHVAILEPAARIVIIENLDTCDSNSEIYRLSEKDRETIRACL